MNRDIERQIVRVEEQGEEQMEAQRYEEELMAYNLESKRVLETRRIEIGRLQDQLERRQEESVRTMDRFYRDQAQV